MKNLAFAALLACIMTSTGCVLGRRSLDIPVPAATPISASTALGTYAITSVTDARTFENKPPQPSTPSIDGDVAKVPKDQLRRMIGRQRNGYGAAMGDVQLANNVTVDSQFRELLRASFERAGYKPADTNAPPDISASATVGKFWGWMSPGWSLHFEANVDSELTILHHGHTETIHLTGHGKISGQAPTDANWRGAYTLAYQDFIDNFIDALAKLGLTDGTASSSKKAAPSVSGKVNLGDPG